MPCISLRPLGQELSRRYCLLIIFFIAYLISFISLHAIREGKIVFKGLTSRNAFSLLYPLSLILFAALYNPLPRVFASMTNLAPFE